MPMYFDLSLSPATSHQDSDSAQMELVEKDEDEVKLRHLSTKDVKKKEKSSSDSQ